MLLIIRVLRFVKLVTRDYSVRNVRLLFNLIVYLHGGFAPDEVRPRVIAPMSNDETLRVEKDGMQSAQSEFGVQ